MPQFEVETNFHQRQFMESKDEFANRKKKMTELQTKLIESIRNIYLEKLKRRREEKLKQMIKIKGGKIEHSRFYIKLNRVVDMIEMYKSISER